MSSGIEWTGDTWNPVVGCTRVSAGCDHCYAARDAATRLSGTRHYRGLAVLTGSGRAAFTGEVRLVPERLEQPLRWQRPRRVFPCSMSDLFHDDVPEEYLDRVFAVMALAHRHTFQVLTKRQQRMRAYLRAPLRDTLVEGAAQAWYAGRHPDEADTVGEWLAVHLPLPNVHLGVSGEDQAAADARLAALCDTPATLRWLSAEPLLGPLELTPWLVAPRARGLEWVVVGGESGPGARPMDLAWVREIVAQCRAAGVAVFVKQLGAVAGAAVGCRDAKGGDVARWPPDLLVREFPSTLEAA